MAAYKDWDEAGRAGLSALEATDRVWAEHNKKTQGSEQHAAGSAKQGIGSNRKQHTDDASSARPDPSFTLFDDIEHEPRKKCLVNGLLGDGELSCTFGAPSAGKSLLVGDRNWHIADGRPWFDRRVERRAVLQAH
jgi:hypothetical protein